MPPAKPLTPPLTPEPIGETAGLRGDAIPSTTRLFKGGELIPLAIEPEDVIFVNRCERYVRVIKIFNMFLKVQTKL